MKLKVVYTHKEEDSVVEGYFQNNPLRITYKYLYDVFLDDKKIGVFWRNETHTRFIDNGELSFQKNQEIWNFLNKHIEKIEGIVRKKTFNLSDIFFRCV